MAAVAAVADPLGRRKLGGVVGVGVDYFLGQGDKLGSSNRIGLTRTRENSSGRLGGSPLQAALFCVSPEDHDTTDWVVNRNICSDFGL